MCFTNTLLSWIGLVVFLVETKKEIDLFFHTIIVDVLDVVLIEETRQDDLYFLYNDSAEFLYKWNY